MLSESPAALAHRSWQSQQQSQAAKANNASAHGSAEWLAASDYEGAGLLDAQKAPFLMGRSDAGALLRYGGDGHILTFAPTGAGKGVSVVVPNLLEYRGSVVCIDPKGAIAAVTAAHRCEVMKQKIILLDPFGEVERAVRATGRPDLWPRIEPASCNPFGYLEKTSPDAVDDARLIASSLILAESEKTAIFPTARAWWWKG